jgi:hypothetical protein
MLQKFKNEKEKAFFSKSKLGRKPDPVIRGGWSAN